MKTSSRTRGSSSARSSSASTSSSERDRVDEHPHRQVAVARADERGEPGVGADRPGEPPPCRSSMTLGRLDARQVVSRFGDIGRDDQDGCREPVVVERRKPVVRGERLGEVRAEGGAAGRAPAAPARTARASVRLRSDAAAARSRIRPRCTSRAEKSSSHASTSAANSGVPGSVPPSRIHSSAYDSGSSVSRSIDPCVQRNRRCRDPRRARGRVPIAVAALPVAEQLRHAARSEMRAHAARRRPRRGRRPASRRRGTRTPAHRRPAA